jgi:gamma-glutamyltranspeptidase
LRRVPARADNARDKSVSALNGSGRAPASLTVEQARADMGRTPVVYGGAPAGWAGTDFPGGRENQHVHGVTVPGAAAGWLDALARWGRLSAAQVLAPAIELATQSFPVGPVTCNAWAKPTAPAAAPATGRKSFILLQGRPTFYREYRTKKSGLQQNHAPADG